MLLGCWRKVLDCVRERCGSCAAGNLGKPYQVKKIRVVAALNDVT